MSNLQKISENSESTIVTKYINTKKNNFSFQSEAELEESFIEQLVKQGYEYLPVKDEEGLIENLRKQIEKINNYIFTDNDWSDFFNSKIANKNWHVKEKSRLIQESACVDIRTSDGSIKNIKLLDKKDIFKNKIQVINQYRTVNSKNRYDVTLLINGLPLVHVELKRRGVNLKEAFNQINRYQNETFWQNSGLFEYIQIFVISNGTHTKYYSNTVRDIRINGSNRKNNDSYKFTINWADAENRPIEDLEDFTSTFLQKRTLLNVLFKYCVFTAEDKLLVMRPYQIVGCEKIINLIEMSENHKFYSTINGCGYLYHATGSGKTLESFKVAQLATALPYIDKVLFVVDRKDLDAQTQKEYDKFKKGSANACHSTEKLRKNMEDLSCKITICTIQKLNEFCKKYPKHEVFNKRVVLIFDECHRSQFGEYHKNITKSFKKYNLFGYTGTPIFAENAKSLKDPTKATTAQIFGKQLHAYTIVDSIEDEKTLPFKVETVNTIAEKEETDDDEVEDINRKKILLDPRRINNVVKYILDNFAKKTCASTPYSHKIEGETRCLTGFNSIFAVQDIDYAKSYYAEFKRQQSELPISKRLKVATIYSYAPNEDFGDENNESVNGLDLTSKEFLANAIVDYNKMFNTTYDISNFNNYYQDISRRVKNKEIDILIVVNMFLTGFDSPLTNTLWVDKNLKYHGLIQAFSRTNRILNSQKRFGNIVSFRNLEESTNEAFALFGGNKQGIILLKTFKDYYEGYYADNGEYFEGYVELVNKLTNEYPLNNFRQCIIGEENKKKFVKLFSAILRSINILSTFDEFEGKEILSERTFQDYCSNYQDLHIRNKNSVLTADVNDDIEFEIELLKTFDVNVDYILKQIDTLKNNHFDTEIVNRIMSTVNASTSLRSKKEVIAEFIEKLQGSYEEKFENFVNESAEEEIKEIASTENIELKKVIKFMNEMLKRHEFAFSWSEIQRLVKGSFFEKQEDTEARRNRVVEKLKKFFDTYGDMEVKLNG